MAYGKGRPVFLKTALLHMMVSPATAAVAYHGEARGGNHVYGGMVI